MTATCLGWRAGLASFDDCDLSFLLGGLMDDFSGDLFDSDVAALCNVMQNGRKSGTLVLDCDGSVGSVYFVDGQVIDAEVGRLGGVEAVYHLLRWQRGVFRLNFGVPERAVAIAVPTAELLLEGAFAFDVWKRRVDDLPRTPQEAFDLPPAPVVDQSYLDVPLAGEPPWRRGALTLERFFWGTRR